MNDNAASNIKQILDSFDKFVGILEASTWVRFAKAEDIKTAFKLGYFLEKTIAHFKSKNSLAEFMNMLIKWWETKNRTCVYNVLFFQFACDQLLIRFFKCENIADVTLDIVIRVYTSIFPRARLQKVLSHLILTSSSYEAITDFAIANMSANEAKDLEYQLKLANWTDMYQSGRENEIRDEIRSLLSLYKVESTLYILIGVLSLSDVSQSERYVQSIILENVLKKMLDRSILSKTFWLTLFHKVELVYVCKSCNIFKDFFKSLFNFIVYAGSMMKNENDTWKSDESVSLCPEINYKDLLILVRGIYNLNASLKESVIEILNEAKEHTESCIWDQIRQEL